MSIQILPSDQGGAAQAFGQALGGGISQQLPEEIKRYRIKSGLENLGNQKGLSDFQVYSQLASIPGIDPGLLGVLAPALQQHLSRNEFLAGQGSGFGGQPPGQNPSQQANQPNFAPQGNQAPGAVPQDLLARNLSILYPNRFRDPEKSLSEETRRETSFKNEFDDATKSFLQKGKELAEGEIGGDVLKLAKERGRQELAEGRSSAESIALKYAQQAKEVAKDLQSFKKIHNDIDISKFSNRKNLTQKTFDDMRATSQRLLDSGIPQDQVVDHLQSSFNISRGYAETFVPQDPKVSSYVNKVPKRQISSFFNRNQPKMSEADIAKQIAPLITNTTLLGSIAYDLKQKGYDQNAVLQEIQRINGKKLTTEQERDIANQNLVPRVPSMDEIYLRSK